MKPRSVTVDKGSMKRRSVLVIALTLLFSASAVALTVVNPGSSVQYFFVSELAPRDISVEIADQRELENYVQRNMFRMRYIAPGAARPAVSVPAEGGTLVVLHVTPGAAEYEVSFHPIDPRTPEVHPQPEGEARFASVQALDIRLPSTPIRIDNRYVDWERVSAIAEFSEATAPQTFFRRLPEGQEEPPLAEALSWPKVGTELDTLKTAVGDAALYLLASATREFGENTSIFVYAYADRDAPRADFTLEVPFAAKTNTVLLWEPDRDAPRVVGDFARAGLLVEARVFLSELPMATSALDSATASIDVSTAYHFPNRFEEFFQTTIFLRDVPRRGAGM